MPDSTPPRRIGADEIKVGQRLSFDGNAGRVVAAGTTFGEPSVVIRYDAGGEVNYPRDGFTTVTLLADAPTEDRRVSEFERGRIAVLRDFATMYRERGYTSVTMRPDEFDRMADEIAAAAADAPTEARPTDLARYLHVCHVNGVEPSEDKVRAILSGEVAAPSPSPYEGMWRDMMGRRDALAATLAEVREYLEYVRRDTSGTYGTHAVALAEQLLALLPSDEEDS